LDVDLEVPATAILDCVRAIRAGADVAIGGRTYTFFPGEVMRRFLSRGYAFLVHRLLPVGTIADTEAGCKFFRRITALPVLNQVEAPGWFWDTESVVRCHLAGLRMVQVPCVYTRDQAKPSSVRLLHDIMTTLSTLLAFRRSLGRVHGLARRPIAR
jgi:hypothetical protein